MHRMGEEISEQLHIEVKASVLQHVRFKYACRHCERFAERTPILTAPMPAQPLPGSQASAAMIATVTTSKYVDGTPLYRMEDALGRANIPVGRGTLGHWVIKPRQLHLDRLYKALRKTLLSQPLIHGDETTVQVLKDDSVVRLSTRTWQAISPGVSRGLQRHGDVRRDSAWRTVKGVTHFGCLAHARRGFVEALKTQKKTRQTRANYTLRLRQQHSVALLEAFKAWLDEQAPQRKCRPKARWAMPSATRLTRGSISAVTSATDKPPVDNNIVERDIRPFATSRKDCVAKRLKFACPEMSAPASLHPNQTRLQVCEEHRHLLATKLLAKQNAYRRRGLGIRSSPSRCQSL